MVVVVVVVVVVVGGSSGCNGEGHDCGGNRGGQGNGRSGDKDYDCGGNGGGHDGSGCISAKVTIVVGMMVVMVAVS